MGYNADFDRSDQHGMRQIFSLGSQIFVSGAPARKSRGHGGLSSNFLTPGHSLSTQFGGSVSHHAVWVTKIWGLDPLQKLFLP